MFGRDPASHRSIRTPALVLTAAGVIAALGAVVNWPSGMNAEVAGGVIFLLATVLGVDWFVARGNELQRARELRDRWAGLGGVPFRGLSGAAGDVVDGLAWTLTGAHPFDRPHDVSDGMASSLDTALKGLATSDAPAERRQLLLDRRLTALLADASWCGLAVKVIDLLKWRYRERIGAWAGPMLDHPDVARVLRRMALLDDRIGDLQAPLRGLADAPHGAGADDAALVAKRWFAVLAECISLREDLHRAAIVGDPADDSARRALQAYASLRHWLRPPDEALLGDRADWTVAAASDLAVWRTRREQVLATPLDENAGGVARCRSDRRRRIVDSGGSPRVKEPG